MKEINVFNLERIYEMMKDNFQKMMNNGDVVGSIERSIKKYELHAKGESFLPEYKEFVQNSSNFILGNFYFMMNIGECYLRVNDFRIKHLSNLEGKLREGEITSEELVKFLQLAMKKEIEMKIADEKNFTDIKQQYYNHYLNAVQDLILGDNSKMKKFAERYKEEQSVIKDGFASYIKEESKEEDSENNIFKGIKDKKWETGSDFIKRILSEKKMKERAAA